MLKIISFLLIININRIWCSNDIITTGDGLTIFGKTFGIIFAWKITDINPVKNQVPPDGGRCLELLDKKVVASGLVSGTINLYNGTDMTEMFSKNNHNEEIRAISEINSTVFASLSQRYLIFWNSSNLIQIHKITNTFEGVSMKTLANRSILAISEKQTASKFNIRFLNLNTLTNANTKLISYNSEILFLELVENNLAYGVKDSVYVYDPYLQTNKSNFQIGGNVEALRYTKNNILACATSNFKIELWDILIKTKKFTFTGHSDRIESMDALNDILVSVGHDRVIKLWNITSLTFIRDLGKKIVFGSPFYDHWNPIKAVIFVNTSTTTKSITTTSTKLKTTTITTPTSSFSNSLEKISEAILFSISSDKITEPTSVISNPVETIAEPTSIINFTYETVTEPTSFISFPFEIIREPTAIFENTLLILETTEISEQKTTLSSLSSPVNDVLHFMSGSYDLTHCLSNCSNKGSCILSTNNQFSCSCEKNYAGPSCQINLRPCSSNPCRNNGTCLDYSSGLNTNQTNFYSCECDKTYYGLNCEKEIDVCENETCTKQGVCFKDNKEPKCKCFGSYSGDKCEIESSEMKAIKVTIKTASIIAIIILIVFYLLFIGSDLMKLYISK